MRWSGLRRIEGAALISRGRRSRALLPAEAISGTQFTGTSQSTFPDRALLETRIGDFATSGIPLRCHHLYCKPTR